MLKELQLRLKQAQNIAHALNKQAQGQQENFLDKSRSENALEAIKKYKSLVNARYYSIFRVMYAESPRRRIDYFAQEKQALCFAKARREQGYGLVEVAEIDCSTYSEQEDAQALDRIEYALIDYYTTRDS